MKRFLSEPSKRHTHTHRLRGDRRGDLERFRKARAGTRFRSREEGEEEEEVELFLEIFFFFFPFFFPLEELLSSCTTLELEDELEELFPDFLLTIPPRSWDNSSHGAGVPITATR